MYDKLILLFIEVRFKLCYLIKVTIVQIISVRSHVSLGSKHQEQKY